MVVFMSSRLHMLRNLFDEQLRFTFRCRLFSGPPIAACSNSATSADDCIPASLAMFPASEPSNLNSMSQISNCDSCPSLRFKTYAYSSPVVTTSFIPTFSRLPYCSCSSYSHSFSSCSPSIFSSLLRSKCNLRRSVSSSDDEMNANSPDSGFESTSPNGNSMVDCFDALKPDDSFDDSSTSSSTITLPSASTRLCLKPPVPAIQTEVKGRIAEP